MTKLGNEIGRYDASTAKKRALAVKARMEELGYKPPMSHAYEVFATAAGFRNWPTMKSKLNTAAHRGSDAWDTSAGTVPQCGSTNTKVRLTSEDVASVGGPTESRMDTGETDDIVAWIAGKIDDRGSFGAMWKGRVTGFLYSVIAVLVHLRDKHGETLTTDAVRECLTADGYAKLARDRRFDAATPFVKQRVEAIRGSAADTTNGEALHPWQQPGDHEYMAALVSDALNSIDTEIRWHNVRTRPTKGSMIQVFHHDNLVREGYLDAVPA